MMSVLDQFKLDDKVAIVTGGASGLGKSNGESFSRSSKFSHR